MLRLKVASMGNSLILSTFRKYSSSVTSWLVATASGVSKVPSRCLYFAPALPQPSRRTTVSPIYAVPVVVTDSAR